MRSAIDDVLAASKGVAGRAALLTAVTRTQLDDEIARGHLVALFPRAYCRPWDADLVPIMRRAALCSVGPKAALSHVTTLQVLDLPTPDAPDDTVHVTTSAKRHPLCADPRLVVHRTRLRTPICRVDGMATVPPAVAVATSWPLLPVTDRRAPAIEAVRRKLVTPDELRAALLPRVGLAGRSSQLQLADLLAAGCESELEIWGHTHVFAVRGLDHGEPQFWITTRIGRVRLDIGFETERVALEMDGWRYHRTKKRRERDLRRDAALAAIGWLTLRFSHERLHDDIAGCRRDALATLAARRQSSA